MSRLRSQHLRSAGGNGKQHTAEESAVSYRHRAIWSFRFYAFIQDKLKDHHTTARKQMLTAALFKTDSSKQGLRLPAWR